MTDGTRWRASRILQLLALAGAALWSVGLLVAATTVSVYETETSSSTGSGSTESISSNGETLVGENGTWVLIVLAVPLAATLLVALALFIRRRWALWIACAITATLVLGNLAAMLTVGIFVLPVTGALAVSCLCGFLSQPTDRTRVPAG